MSENNTPKTTYFVCLSGDERAHSLFTELSKVISEQRESMQALTIQYANEAELMSGTLALCSGGRTDRNHIVRIASVPTNTYCKPFEKGARHYRWTAEIGKKIVPPLNKDDTDRVKGAAQFLFAVFVRRIDDQLTKGCYPWGPKPMTLEQRREARRAKAQSVPDPVASKPHNESAWRLLRGAHGSRIEEWSLEAAQPTNDATPGAWAQQHYGDTGKSPQ